jgi:hypothetical protein
MNKLISEEIERIKLLSKYDNSKTLSEQSNPIVNDLYYSVAGPGTNTEKFKNAIMKINNANEFLLINAELKKYLNSTLDIAGWINDDFDATNIDDIIKISDHLKSRGVNNTYETYSDKYDSNKKYFKPNTFKILTTPAKPAANPAAKPAANPAAKPVATPPELKNIKAFQDWLDVNAKGWATGYKDGIINKGQNGAGYGKFGPRTQKAWATYKDQYLKGGAKTEQPVAQTTEPDKKPLTVDTLPTNGQPLNLQLSPKQAELNALKWGQQ